MFQKYKFTIISLVIILIAAIPLLLLSKKTPTKMPVGTVSPTPSVAPLTTQNADETLEKADTNLQQTLNQVDIDLNAAAQVDSSQDSTAGL